jgi:hypothetical protein
MLDVNPDILASLDCAARGDGPAPIVHVAVDIDHPDGRVRVHNGFEPFTDADENEWLGMGVLGGVSQVVETSELQVQEATLTLTGLPAFAEDKVNDDVAGRLATVYQVFLRPDRTVIGMIARAVIRLERSAWAMSEDGAVSLSLIGTTGFWFLTGAPGATWSREDQQQEYPADTGFDFIRDQAGKSLSWGK